MRHDVSLDHSSRPHEEWEERLGAYLDDELDAPSRARVERHLEECADCRARFERLIALRDALRRELPAEHVPDLLRARILGNVRAAAGREVQRSSPNAGHSAGAPATTAALRRWRWMALAASTLFVVSTTYGVLATRSAHNNAALAADSATDAIAHDVLASHVRALMPGHLTDVASTNRHNVKPWFNGRLDYSPPVYDLSADGFPLVGGRVDYVGGRAVAVLVYQRRQHVISLYVWPSERTGMPAPAQPSARTRQGYHMLTWTRGGMTRWAVSDLNVDELREFAAMEQRADTP